MRENIKTKNAYEKHSKYTTQKDSKFRKYYFIIENLDNDYEITIQEISKYDNIKFDFCASCLYNDFPMLRVFWTWYTWRFSIDTNKIKLLDLKNKLIQDWFQFAQLCEKSWPLCLNDDFSERISTKKFRLLLPVREIYQFIKFDIFKFNK